jgi:hypothetical protein
MPSLPLVPHHRPARDRQPVRPQTAGTPRSPGLGGQEVAEEQDVQAAADEVGHGFSWAVDDLAQQVGVHMSLHGQPLGRPPGQGDDHQLAAMRLDRRLYSAVSFPADYGLVICAGSASLGPFRGATRTMRPDA